MINHSPRSRNRLALLLATALLSTAAMAGTASAATTTLSNSTPITIPDSGPATPYPSPINAVGFAGNVQKATVTLRSLSHTCPEDIQALLVGPSGAKSVLMANVGGCPQTDIPPVDLTFDQAAPSTILEMVVPPSGTYRPSESGTTSSLTPPAPPNPYQANLDVFNNTPANGTWQLFIEDCCGADQGSIGGGWSLNLTAPVNTVKAGKAKLNKKKGTAQIPVTVGDAGRLKVSGKGVKGKAKNTAGPGTVKLTVGAKGSARQTLNSTGHVTVKAKITFTPNGGASSTVKKKIKLKS
jgi:subtilisin-like proprotein convertase family protein